MLARERLDAIRVARYLETGELPSAAQVARSVGVTERKLACDLSRPAMPERYGEYAHVPTAHLYGRDGLLKWVKL